MWEGVVGEEEGEDEGLEGWGVAAEEEERVEDTHGLEKQLSASDTMLLSKCNVVLVLLSVFFLQLPLLGYMFCPFLTGFFVQKDVFYDLSLSVNEPNEEIAQHSDIGFCKPNFPYLFAVGMRIQFPYVF